MSIYIIHVETRHGTDTILVRKEPTRMDLGLIENYYLTQFDLPNVHVDYVDSIVYQDIPKSVTEYIDKPITVTISSRVMDQL